MGQAQLHTEIVKLIWIKNGSKEVKKNNELMRLEKEKYEKRNN